ncbi:MAG: hypothetical protein OXH14_14955, partial [Alphaproteobacteria bacterium]|nr:hypothetical protein [Alphaproteobacteria bacterium]
MPGSIVENMSEFMQQFLVAPDPDDPRLTEAVTGIDHEGQERSTRVVVERPLTIYLNSQEVRFR